jgi:uncharacterized MAPEG superfamily protein
MDAAKKTVAVGAASGIAGMFALVTILSLALPAPSDIETLVDRLAFALKLNVFAVLPFLVMIITVANSRFLSEAIDPLAQKESTSQLVDGRVTDNTLQQNFVFFVGTLALSTVLEARHLQVLTAATIVFVLARIVFWIGYRRHPLYRAPGMSATGYLNLGVLGATIYLTLF